MANQTIPPCVLYYGLKNQLQEKQMESLLARFNLQAVRVDPRMINQPVGSFAGLVEKTDLPDYTGAIPTESIVIMHALPDAMIRDLLAALREAADLHIQLKAVITEHNSHWPFFELAAELKQEHEAMRVFMSARHLIGQAENWLKQNDTASGAEQPQIDKLQQLVTKGNSVISAAQESDSFDLRELAEIGAQIATLMNQLNQKDS